MHPFISYEVAMGMVEEMRAISERRRKWRRNENQEVVPTPTRDAVVVQLLAHYSEDEQERIGA